MASPRTSKAQPKIMEMPAQKMAVVEGIGTPAKLFGELAPALYRTVYALEGELKKRGSKFKAGVLRARYPEISNDPDNWRIIIGTPVPDDVALLPDQSSDVKVTLETWQYGTVAQIMHYGPYDAVQASLTRLHDFVAASGYLISGPYEEEYLSGPEARVPRTIVRFEVKKR